MIDDFQLPALYSVALLSRIPGLDNSETLTIVESVCGECPPVSLVPEYLVSSISKYARLDSNFPFLKNQRRLSLALGNAEEWYSTGVRVLPTQKNPKLTMAKDCSRVVFTFGQIEILENTLAMIVNSRVSKKVFATGGWVVKTVALARHAIENHWTLVSSCGSVPYLLVSWLAKGRSAVVVMDSPLPFMCNSKISQTFSKDFLDIFDVKSTLFISQFAMGTLPSAGQRMMRRDTMAVCLSDVLMPCEVRSGGNMEKLLNSSQAKHKIKISLQNFCEETDSGVESKNKSEHEFNPDVQGKLNFFTTVRNGDFTQSEALCSTRMLRNNHFSDYLFHYTRSCSGPWPGQTWHDYLNDLAFNNLGSEHQALDTLRRILGEGRIRASGKWIKGSFPVVSFTEIPPEDFNLICRWRRGLARKTFEPYGIALKKSVLLKMGARKVLYGDDEQFDDMGKDMKPYFQKASSACADWSTEKEWRLTGDLEFHGFHHSQWFAIVPRVNDLDHLARNLGLEEFQALVFGNTLEVIP